LSYALAVPDLEAGRRFYMTFGLSAVPRGNGLALRCEGRDQDQILLVEGPRKRLAHLRFGTGASGLADIRTRLARAGGREIDPPRHADQEALWLADPDGHPVEVRIESAKPWRPAGTLAWNGPGAYARIGARGCRGTAPVRPHRLGHVLLHTPRLEAMIEFYQQVLGLRLSDRVPGFVSFLHVPGGGDHHVVALLACDRPGFHHASFEVASPDEIGLGAAQVLAAGYRDGWGFGRHVLGSNFFHYLRDPWGSLAEYFWDIDQIPADGSWQAADHAGEDALYRWGPPPPADFAANFEAD
jgi:catechol-2,3-dioxygenase